VGHTHTLIHTLTETQRHKNHDLFHIVHSRHTHEHAHTHTRTHTRTHTYIHTLHTHSHKTHSHTHAHNNATHTFTQLHNHAHTNTHAHLHINIQHCKHSQEGAMSHIRNGLAEILKSQPIPHFTIQENYRADF